MRFTSICLCLLFARTAVSGSPVAAASAASKTTSRERQADLARALPAAYSGPVRIDLSGSWDFRFDPDGQGENGRWFDPHVSGPWEKATVPGSFNVEFAKHPDAPDPDDAYLFYKGKAWYRRRFVAPASRADVFLHLSGTVLRNKVWLNGELMGAWALPWLDATYDVSSLLHCGRENTLVIEVDDSIQPDAIPDTKWRGWWDDGGLIWPVYLEERQPVRSDSFVTTRMLPEGNWRLQVDTSVQEDEPAKAAVELLLTDDRGGVIWRKTEDAAASAQPVRVIATADLEGIQPWSPEHPVLYRLTVKTSASGQSADVISFQIGFRQIEARGARLYLNGEPLTLRGINRHEFAPGAGQSVSVVQNRRDMEQIKALGANFIRLAHYSQSQDVYADCDRLGLLVWTEMPAWQSSVATLTSPEVWQKYARPGLDEMIRQHRNHPSVIIWSVANEIPSDKPEVASYVAKAIAEVHRLDPTRLATFASDKREKDVSMGPEDIISVNEYFGWYYGKLDDVGPMLDRMHRKYPDKPILVSEFGSESVDHWDPKTARDGSKDYSYQYQVKFLTSHLQQIYAPQRRAYVAGGTIWVYADFPDPHRINGDHPDIARYRNSKGLVTMDRTPKPAFQVVSRFYHQLMREDDSSEGAQH